MKKCQKSLWTHLTEHPEFINFQLVPEYNQRFEQSTPAVYWEFEHDFGRVPSLVVTDLNNVNIAINPTILNEVRVILEFPLAMAGYVYLS